MPVARVGWGFSPTRFQCKANLQVVVRMVSCIGCPRLQVSKRHCVQGCFLNVALGLSWVFIKFLVVCISSCSQLHVEGRAGKRAMLGHCWTCEVPLLVFGSAFASVLAMSYALCTLQTGWVGQWQVACRRRLPRERLHSKKLADRKTSMFTSKDARRWYLSILIMKRLDSVG